MGGFPRFQSPTALGDCGLIQRPAEDSMTPGMLTSVRELHSRVSDGVCVRLLWCQHGGRVFVAVNDHKSGDAFSLEVPEGERPLQVFHHPYAYASWSRNPGSWWVKPL
jgi:hypothetical protein